VAGNAEVGYFTAADKLIRAVAALSNPATQSLYPRLNALRVGSDRSALALIRTSTIWLTALSTAASLAVFFLAPLAGPMLWGQLFIPSVRILRCLAPLPALLALINAFGAQTMLVFGLDSLVSRISLFCTILNAILTMLLGRFFGATGAAVAIVCATCVMLVSLCLGLRWNWAAAPAAETETAAAMNVRCE
jgi:PST family polysaccharide transporter